MTPENKKILTLIPKVMQMIGNIEKDKRNKYDNYDYVSAEAIKKHVQPALYKNGVTMFYKVLSKEISTVTSSKGASMYRVLLETLYILMADDGSYIECHTFGEGVDRGDKAMNKAVTSSFKNMANVVFCIPVESHDSERFSPEIDHEVPKKPDIKKELTPLQKLRNEIVHFVGEKKIEGAYVSQIIKEQITVNYENKTKLNDLSEKELILVLKTLKEYIQNGRSK